MTALAYTAITDNDHKVVFDFTADADTNGLTSTKEKVIVVLQGGFGSGTATIQYSADLGTTWVSDATLVFTTAGIGIFYSTPQVMFRCHLASSTNPTLKVTFIR